MRSEGWIKLYEEDLATGESTWPHRGALPPVKSSTGVPVVVRSGSGRLEWPAPVHATKVYGELEGRFRESVFFDFLFDPADWVGELIETVRRSALVVALIGTKWLDTLTERRTSGETFSDAVEIELLAALRHEVPVLAVLVEDASLPTLPEVPSELSPLADTPSVRLRDSSWRQDLDAVLHT